MDAHTHTTLSFKLGFAAEKKKCSTLQHFYYIRAEDKSLIKYIYVGGKSKNSPCAHLYRKREAGGWGRGEGGVVIAVCRWRVCGSCWL